MTTDNKIELVDRYDDFIPLLGLKETDKRGAFYYNMLYDMGKTIEKKSDETIHAYTSNNLKLAYKYNKYEVYENICDINIPKEINDNIYALSIIFKPLLSLSGFVLHIFNELIRCCSIMESSFSHVAMNNSHDKYQYLVTAQTIVSLGAGLVGLSVIEQIIYWLSINFINDMNNMLGQIVTNNDMYSNVNSLDIVFRSVSNIQLLKNKRLLQLLFNKFIPQQLYKLQVIEFLLKLGGVLLPNLAFTNVNLPMFVAGGWWFVELKSLHFFRNYNNNLNPIEFDVPLINLLISNRFVGHLENKYLINDNLKLVTTPGGIRKEIIDDELLNYNPKNIINSLRALNKYYYSKDGYNKDNTKFRNQISFFFNNNYIYNTVLLMNNYDLGLYNYYNNYIIINNPEIKKNNVHTIETILWSQYDSILKNNKYKHDGKDIIEKYIIFMNNYEYPTINKANPIERALSVGMRQEHTTDIRNFISGQRMYPKEPGISNIILVIINNMKNLLNKNETNILSDIDNYKFMLSVLKNLIIEVIISQTINEIIKKNPITKNKNEYINKSKYLSLVISYISMDAYLNSYYSYIKYLSKKNITLNEKLENEVLIINMLEIAKESSSILMIELSKNNNNILRWEEDGDIKKPNIPNDKFSELPAQMTIEQFKSTNKNINKYSNVPNVHHEWLYFFAEVAVNLTCEFNNDYNLDYDTYCCNSDNKGKTIDLNDSQYELVKKAISLLQQKINTGNKFNKSIENVVLVVLNNIAYFTKDNDTYKYYFENNKNQIDVNNMKIHYYPFCTIVKNLSNLNSLFFSVNTKLYEYLNTNHIIEYNNININKGGITLTSNNYKLNRLNVYSHYSLNTWDYKNDCNTSYLQTIAYLYSLLGLQPYILSYLQILKSLPLPYGWYDSDKYKLSNLPINSALHIKEQFYVNRGIDLIIKNVIKSNNNLDYEQQTYLSNIFYTIQPNKDKSTWPVNDETWFKTIIFCLRQAFIRKNNNPFTLKSFSYELSKYQIKRLLLEDKIEAIPIDETSDFFDDVDDKKQNEYKNKYFRCNIGNNINVLCKKDKNGNLINIDQELNDLIDNNNQYDTCYTTRFIDSKITNNGNEETYKCSDYFEDCLTGKNIENCKIFLQSPNFWPTALKEIKEMNPRMMIKTLTKFGFKQILDGNTNLYAYESVNDWLEGLKGKFKNSDNNTNIDNIISNTNLKTYLNEIVSMVNLNPAILNKEYTGPIMDRKPIVPNHNDRIPTWQPLNSFPKSSSTSGDFSVLGNEVSQWNKLIKNYIDRQYTRYNMDNNYIYNLTTSNLSPNIVTLLKGWPVSVQHFNDSKNIKIKLEGFDDSKRIYPNYKHIIDNLIKTLSIKNIHIDKNISNNIDKSLEEIRSNEIKMTKLIDYLNKYYNIISTYGFDDKNNILTVKNLKLLVDKHSDKFTKIRKNIYSLSDITEHLVNLLNNNI